MRIISGQFKGRRIHAPGDITARPTTDFAKEGLFNLLNNRIDFEGLQVLDLFAGTGSISIEFISRGCNNTTTIEQNEKHCAFIRKTCKDLKIENMNLIKTDVFRFMNACHTDFDVIFADPPYELEKLSLIPDAIFGQDLLRDNGILILEHGKKHDFSEHPHFSFHRNYGNVNFTFFENKPNWPE